MAINNLEFTTIMQQELDQHIVAEKDSFGLKLEVIEWIESYI